MPAVGSIDVALKRRLKLLFDADIGLAAYHLPLDAHPEIGNNALLARALGAERLEPFGLHEGEPIGFVASLPGEGLAAAELFARVRELTAREPLVFDSGPAQVRRLAIVSGAGADFLADAATAGADALLTGRAGRAHDGAGARVRACTSSPPAITRPRRSASGAWASTSPSVSTCATSSWTFRTRCEPRERSDSRRRQSRNARKRAPTPESKHRSQRLRSRGPFA